jgi:hypothetical protein
VADDFGSASAPGSFQFAETVSPEQPKTFCPATTPDEVAGFIHDKGIVCPTEGDLLTLGIMAYQLHWEAVFASSTGPLNTPVQDLIALNVSKCYKYVEAALERGEASKRQAAPSGDLGTRNARLSRGEGPFACLESCGPQERPSCCCALLSGSQAQGEGSSPQHTRRAEGPSTCTISLSPGP